MLTLAFAGGEAPPPGTGREVNEWLDDSGVVFARAFSSKDLRWIDWVGLGVFAFTASSNEVRVWPHPDAGKEIVRHTFSRALQPVILQVLGWQALHASAAIGRAGVLAFCGSKGSGKSTLAFAMRQTGWQPFADDALVLRLDRNRVKACALPFRPRLRPPSLAYFGNVDLAPALEPQPADVPLVGLFLLKQDTGLMSPRVSLIPKSRGFLELLAHAHCFDASDATHTQPLVIDYLNIAERVPIFRLEYRPEFQYLPKLTCAVLEALRTIDAACDGRSDLRHTALAPC